MPLFTGKNNLLSLLDSLPYTYPWNQMRVWKVLFYWEIWLLFWSEMAVLWGVFEDRHFWLPNCHFWYFRLSPVLWGILVTVSWPNMSLIPGVEDCLNLVWSSSKPPRNLRSLCRRTAFTSLYVPSALLMSSSRGHWGPHPTLPSPEGLFSWDEWPSTFRGGWVSFTLLRV